MSRYLEAVEIYKKYGVDVEKALNTLKDVPVALHCWQGDDVLGFEGSNGLSGGVVSSDRNTNVKLSLSKAFCGIAHFLQRS